MDDLFISLLLEGIASAVEQELAPIISTGAAVVAIVCLALCFWGFKLTKVMFGILCFLIGMLLGISIAMDIGSALGVGQLLGAALGVGLAFISKYIYKALVFLCNAGLVAFLIRLFANDETIGVMGFLGVALGVAVGFLAVKYIRLSLTLFTSLFYGMTAGIAVLLVVGIPNPGIGLLLGAVLVVLGFRYQWKSTGGGSVKDYLLLRKTEAVEEKQLQQTERTVRQTVAPSVIAADTIPSDLLGVAFFAKWKAYAAIPLVAALVLALLPLKMLSVILVMCLAVAVGIYLSPYAGVATMLCGCLPGIIQMLSQLSEYGSLFPFGITHEREVAAKVLFVFFVGVGCRRFLGIGSHVAVFAGAGILASIVMLFFSGSREPEVILFFILSGVCAAAFEEFAMPVIIQRVPKQFRDFFLGGELVVEPVVAAVTVPASAEATEPAAECQPEHLEMETVE